MRRTPSKIKSILKHRSALSTRISRYVCTCALIRQTPIFVVFFRPRNSSRVSRIFTRGLGLSLLQRKPEDWRHLHATPRYMPLLPPGVTPSTSTPPAPVTHADPTPG